MKPVIIVFAGASKSGKSSIAFRLSRDYNLPLVRFSDAVKSRAKELNRSLKPDRKVLQDVGFDWVTKDPTGFCREVCNNKALLAGECGIIDGLRHQSLVPVLKALLPDHDLRMIFFYAPDGVRRERFDPPLSEEEFHAVNSHPVEQELSQLRQICHKEICTDSSVEETYHELTQWLTKQNCCIRVNSESVGIRVRRGFFRLWLCVSLIWVAFVALSLFTNKGSQLFLNELDDAAAVKVFTNKGILPTHCSLARGSAGIDFFTFRGLCWTTLEDYRRLYPEDKDRSDEEILSIRSKETAVTRPDSGLHARWVQLARVGISIPLLILVTGLVTAWVWRGFYEKGIRRHHYPISVANLRTVFWILQRRFFQNRFHAKTGQERGGPSATKSEEDQPTCTVQADSKCSIEEIAPHG